MFSYGSLQDEDIQRTLYQRKLLGFKSTLKGYRLLDNKIESKYPIISKTNNSNEAITGIAFEISSEEVLITDHYEGNNYQRVEVKLESGHTAWCYVMQ